MCWGWVGGFSGTGVLLVADRPLWRGVAWRGQSEFCQVQSLGLAGLACCVLGGFFDVFRKLGDGFNGWAICCPVECLFYFHVPPDLKFSRLNLFFLYALLYNYSRSGVIGDTEWRQNKPWF